MRLLLPARVHRTDTVPIRILLPRDSFPDRSPTVPAWLLLRLCHLYSCNMQVWIQVPSGFFRPYDVHAAFLLPR